MITLTILMLMLLVYAPTTGSYPSTLRLLPLLLLLKLLLPLLVLEFPRRLPFTQWDYWDLNYGSLFTLYW